MPKQVSLDHWTTLFLFAAVQGIFLSIILLTHRKGNVKATRILAFNVFLFSIMLVYYVSYWTGFANVYPWVNGWVSPFNFLYGPLTYFYVRQLEYNSSGKKTWMHFIPAIANAIWSIPLLLQNVLSISFLFGLNLLRPYSLIQYSFVVWAWLSNISLIIYALILHSLLHRDKTLSNSTRKQELLKHTWLRKVVWFYTGFAIATLSYWILVATNLLRLEYDYAISVAMSAFIYMVGYLGFRQPEIFDGYFSFNGTQNQVKYAKSSLKDNQAKEFLDKLTDVMEHEKLYLDSELKIQQLAAHLKISTHHLSQLINECLHQSYSDYINTYRINEARRLLLNPLYEQEKILSIAFDCGFHNKATFNATFKKYTGMAPSEYKRLHQPALTN